MLLPCVVLTMITVHVISVLRSPIPRSICSFLCYTLIPSSSSTYANNWYQLPPILGFYLPFCVLNRDCIHTPSIELAIGSGWEILEFSR